MSGEVELFFQFIGQLTVLAGVYIAASEIYQGLKKKGSRDAK